MGFFRKNNDGNSAALTLLGCQQLAQYDQLKPILQEKEKKERLSLSQNQMKLQNETITILSIKGYQQ